MTSSPSFKSDVLPWPGRHGVLRGAAREAMG
jgi:hypothetical protein